MPKLFVMPLDSDGLRIEVCFELLKVFLGAAGAPYNTGRHSKYLGPLRRRAVFVRVSHYDVVWMVEASMVALVEYKQRHLDVIFMWRHNQPVR